MGNEGILGRATSAVDKSKLAGAKEELEIAIAEIQMEQKGRVTLEMLNNGSLQDKLKGITCHFSNQEITGKYKGYSYKITENLKVVLQNNEGANVALKVEGTISKTGWYCTNVTILLQAQRGEKEEIEKIVYQVNQEQEVEVDEREVSVSFEQEGVNTIRFYGITTGGIQTEICEEEIKIDKTPPEDVSLIQEEILGNSVLVNLQAVDELSGVSRFDIYVDNEKYMETKENKVEIKGLSSTQHTIYAKAIDFAENESEASQSITISIDKVFVKEPVVFESISWASGSSAYETDVDTLAILFDGDLNYDRGIMIDSTYWGNYLIFSTDKSVKIEAYGDTYQDSGGNSDYQILQISKYNSESKQYEKWKEVTTKPREWYELAHFEPGRYKFESKMDGQRRYIRFDEWRLSEE